MFIVIFEDGQIKRVSTLLPEDYAASDDGLLDIIDIGELQEPKQWYDNSWNEIEEI